MLDGHTHLTNTTNKIKNYFENGQISKLAYQSVMSILGSCLNPNKTDEEKAVLESLIKQNYLGEEKLVSLSE
jgi:DNA-directed RNA polymerase